MMRSVAFNKKFKARCRCSSLDIDSDDRGISPEINYVPRRLVLSLFAVWTDTRDNSLTVSSFQLQGKLQVLFRNIAFLVH